MLKGKKSFSLQLLTLVVTFSVLALGGVTNAQCPPAFEIDGIFSISRMGYAAAAVGDVDADGYEDFAIASNGAVSVPGFVHVISGQTHEMLFLLSDTNTLFGGIDFGESLAGVGDINQDGHADILVGVRDSYQERTGHAYVYSGIDGSVLLRVDGQGAKSKFGASVASAGDCNADGINDFLVGALMDDFGGDFAGRVYLYSGSDGSLLNTFTGSAFEHFGYSVAGGEDVNGDGIPDVVVGAPAGDEVAGTVYVYSSDGSAPLYTFTGAVPGGSFSIGKSLTYTGDLNADGVADIVTNVSGVNAVEIHSGVDGSLINVIARPQDPVYLTSNFGLRIAGGGDIDGDGIDDIAIGAPNFEIDGVRRGAVFLYSGSDFQLIRQESSNVERESYGFGLDISGDYNQDGLADLIVGAIDNNDQGSAAGKAYMYTCAPCCNVAGDANHDLSTNIADATFLIDRIFSAGVAPFCADAADANGDNSVNIGDVTNLIVRIFSAGPAPVCGNTGV